ncbi:MAG: alpha/beta fold hydrolase [Balneolales bacterium]|nr:alpha/beta fold hydrolase [Balneolales bacterium]
MEADTLKLTVRGIKYRIIRFNQGLKSENVPIVYLHGFAGGADGFAHIAPHLSREVFAIDLLGHSGTDSPENPNRYALDEQLEDLRLIFENLGLNQFVLLGYSMGGRLAMRYPIQNRNQISALILESSSTGIVNPAERKDRIKRDHLLASRILNDKNEFFVAWNRLPLFSSPDDAPEEPKNRLNELQLEQNPAGLANNLIGFGAGTLIPVSAKELDLPIMVVTGGLDHKYTEMWKTECLSIKTAKHIVIEGAGHRVHLDRPDAYIQQINNFLESDLTTLL